MKANTLPAEMATNELTGPSTAVRGRRLLIVRMVWLAITLLTISVHITGRAYWVSTITSGLTPTDEPGMRAIGLSPTFWVMGITAVPVAYYLVAAVIAWRKFNDWLALFVSVALMTFGPIVVFGGIPRWQVGLAVDSIRAIGWSCFLIFFLLFPDGRFVPRWSRWLAAAWATFALAWLLVPALNLIALSDEADVPFTFMLLGCLGVGAAVQIYRYVRVSNRVQRQQTKWVLFGFIAAFLVLCSAFALGWLGERIVSNGVVRDEFWRVFVLLIMLSMICIPVAIGIAVLRFRLWDIDPLINRALVYGTLTLLLALGFGGSVLVFQGPLRGLFGLILGQNNDLAIIASTLVMVALFQPLRRRIQAIIDRRFYRRKYDAARTLQAFSVTLRDEVELNRLTEDLLKVVEETMQPAHVSLWLRDMPPTPPGIQR